MGVYERIGAKRVINCTGTYTMLGGSILNKSVRDAMDEANSSFAWLWDLQEAACRRIEWLLGVEAVFITTGVYAAIAISTAACMAGSDPEKMRRLPDTSGMRNEIIMQSCLRDHKYDTAVTVAGGKLIEVGDLKGCAPDQIEGAISKRTAAIHYMAHGTTWSYAQEGCRWVPLEKIVEIGHRHGIPVIVDAAFQCYPPENFSRYVEIGADLVAYSTKYFGGPNTAGLLIGRRDLIDVVNLHSFVGQEGGPRFKEMLLGNGYQEFSSMFRGYKVDRASVVGAVIALETYLEGLKHPEKMLKPSRDKLNYMAKALQCIRDIEITSTVRANPLNLSLQLILKGRTPEETHKIVDRLSSGSPEIWLAFQGNSLIVNVSSGRGLPLLVDGDEKIIVERIKEVLAK